ncbi:hypothetical protein LEP1GSC018_4018 [Leptospira kirschneri str. 2008720114]|nr:hypothetical protein LEP1GSC018_4018 [Leptospira kirschneri str. 2008720114]
MRFKERNVPRKLQSILFAKYMKLLSYLNNLDCFRFRFSK